MALLFNPTGEVIKCQHGGLYTLFKPGEKKEIWDNYAAEHFLNRWGKFGLVKLSYGEKEAQKYSDFEEYEHSQRLLGLVQYMETLQTRVYDYESYDESCDTKKSAHRRLFNEQKKDVQKALDKVAMEVARLESINPKKTPQERAAALRKKAKELEEQAQKELESVSSTSLNKKEKYGDNAPKFN